jgi:geranylgeranyl pyrophosphate synthase
MAATIEQLHASGHLDEVGRTAMLAALQRRESRERATAKTFADVRWLAALIERHGGADYAREVALEHVRAAEQALDGCRALLAAGEARDFLFALPRYVLERLR